MATRSKKTKTEKNEVASMVVPVKDWEHWRQSGNVRRWFAVLLTMNIEPTDPNRKRLKTESSTLYQLYRDRLSIITRRSSTYPALKSVPNPKAGDEPRNQYIRLSGILRFAKQEKWQSIEEFEAGISKKCVTAYDGTEVEISNVAKIDDLAKGQRNTLVRYAALVELLKRSLLSETSRNEVREKFFKQSNEVSNSAIGRAVESVVAQFAKDAGMKFPAGFKAEKNADEIGLVKRVVDGAF
jgi:hypothetical protein